MCRATTGARVSNPAKDFWKAALGPGATGSDPPASHGAMMKRYCWPLRAKRAIRQVFRYQPLIKVAELISGALRSADFQPAGRTTTSRVPTLPPPADCKSAIQQTRGLRWSLDIFRRLCSEVASRKWPSSRSDVLKVAVRLQPTELRSGLRSRRVSDA